MCLFVTFKKYTTSWCCSGMHCYFKSCVLFSNSLQVFCKQSWVFVQVSVVKCVNYDTIFCLWNTWDSPFKTVARAVGKKDQIPTHLEGIHHTMYKSRAQLLILHVNCILQHNTITFYTPKIGDISVPKPWCWCPVVQSDSKVLSQLMQIVR